MEPFVPLGSGSSALPLHARQDVLQSIDRVGQTVLQPIMLAGAATPPIRPTHGALGHVRMRKFRSIPGIPRRLLSNLSHQLATSFSEAPSLLEPLRPPLGLLVKLPALLGYEKASYQLDRTSLLRIHCRGEAILFPICGRKMALISRLRTAVRLLQRPEASFRTYSLFENALLSHIH